METAIILFSIIQSMGISLGVGSSTLAIVNFFYAIADGKIDETERNFMGVTYTVLRVAMGIIFVSSLLLSIFGYLYKGDDYFTNYNVAQVFLVAILFTNALLMTVKLMPSTFGPAIQASTWYTLGFIMALVSLGLSDFCLTNFFLAYVTFVVLAVAFINGVMSYLKAKREEKSTTTAV